MMSRQFESMLFSVIISCKKRCISFFSYKNKNSNMNQLKDMLVIYTQVGLFGYLKITGYLTGSHIHGKKIRLCLRLERS